MSLTRTELGEKLSRPEGEIIEFLTEKLNKAIEQGKKEKLSSLLRPILREGNRKDKRGVLKALKKTGFWQKALFNQVLKMTKEERNKSIKDLSEETVIGILKLCDQKEKALTQALKSMSLGGAVFPTIEAIKATGTDVARKMFNDTSTPNSVREIIEFAFDQMEIPMETEEKEETEE